ncbi:MAG: ABC transporter ATP-binding protein [Firmicutes bacterium]|nr:ABC transporter ATP-binding protein [Bacillota bacterium]
MMVFQNFEQLFPWYTVRRNITFALDIASKFSNSKTRSKTADYYLELVGLKGFEDLYPHQLSGGMQQRVAIARALSVRPEILLMDEPFGSLDAITRASLQKELIRIWEETNVTIIFVTHNIEEAIILGDKILVLQANPGKIKQIVHNPLKRPRLPDTKEFNAIWENIHSLLTPAGSGKTEEEPRVRGSFQQKPFPVGAYFFEVGAAKEGYHRENS